MLKTVIKHRLGAHAVRSEPQVLVLQLVDALLDVRSVAAVPHEDVNGGSAFPLLGGLLLFGLGVGGGHLRLELVLLDLEVLDLFQAGLQLGFELFNSFLGLLGQLVRSRQLEGLAADRIADLGQFRIQILNPLLGVLRPSRRRSSASSFSRARTTYSLSGSLKNPNIVL